MGVKDALGSQLTVPVINISGCPPNPVNLVGTIVNYLLLGKLPELDDKGRPLLQGWAVVDNVSGEDWRQVQMQLTSGEPIAFRYDLHTPRDVHRSDLTETGVRKQARVAVGETTYDAASNIS